MGMTLEQLKAKVADYVTASKQAGTWNETRNNLAGLLDKIAKTVQIDGLFQDKLPELDGEELPLGKTIEEYFEDLVPAQDYDPNGEHALDPAYPSYRPVSYNYTLGRVKFKTTKKYDDYERAVNSEEEFTAIVNTILKRLYDSYALWKYEAKKGILANIVAKAVGLMDASSATAYVDDTTDIAVGTVYKQGSPAVLAIGFKALDNSEDNHTFAEALADGYLVRLDLVESIDRPVDTETGEAFIEKIKTDVEAAQFANEGHSLNGNTVGSEQGLMLILSKGINPVIQTQVEAGAFHPDKLAVPATIKVVDNFGSDTNKCFAILMDKRMARLHPTYMAVRDQENGDGDFINYFLHSESTAFISKNTFFKVYLEKPAE